MAAPTPQIAPAPAETSAGFGIFLRLAATFLFTAMSLAVRMASAEAPTGQIMFWRSWVALFPVVLYLAWRGQFPRALVTHNPIGHLRRSGMGGASMYFSFLSLAYLPIALATALWFLAPLLAIPAGILFLRERPTGIVIGAALAGFVGVALMLWPALAGPRFDVGAAIGIAAGIATAVTTVLAKVEIKKLTATEATGTIAFYFAVICTLIGLATLPFGWASPSPAVYGWLIAAGLLGGFAHIAMTEAIARAPVSTLAPFEYTAMPLALAFDVLFFAVLPTWLGLLGSVVIVAGAAVVAYEDVRRTRPARSRG
jgi:drug/metabolite transporter (DMT)-like permease